MADKTWKTIQTNNIKNKGKNIWVYDEHDEIFAGVELENMPAGDNVLKRKSINMGKYAYYKHVGPYALIKQADLSIGGRSWQIEDCDNKIIH